MLLWAASQGERSIWAQAFKDTMTPDGTQTGESVAKQLTTSGNEFITTLYKCLVPAEGQNGKALPHMTKFRIKIEQQGILMKTSQKSGGVMQKKCFHMRFFQLNVSTGLFKVFQELSPSKKVKHNIDLRNKIIHVARLEYKFKANYQEEHKEMLAKYKMNELTLPHDMRCPFAVLYN